MIRHDFVATRQDSLLLIIDFQQGLLKSIDSWERTAHKINQLIKAATTLEIPILVTEQYKKGLGETYQELLKEIKSSLIFQKEYFSACLESNFISTLSNYNRRKIVVVGMETHVCVLQTCLDLIQSGFQIHLIADAVASRLNENRDIAISQLRQAGAIISSTEIVIFQWACRANTEEFRKLLPIVK